MLTALSGQEDKASKIAPCQKLKRWEAEIEINRRGCLPP